MILFDSETEAVYDLTVAENAFKPWVAECVFNVLNKRFYYGVTVALKSDAAPELIEMKRLAAATIMSPTISL